MPGRRSRPRLDRSCKKRQKLDQDGRWLNNNNNAASTPSSYDDLPPNIWAKALDFLPMSDVLNCSIASKFFLHQVSPLIRYLLVRSSANLLGHKARQRFSGVCNIFIYTLIEPTPEEPTRPKFCFATSSQLVPFLGSFPKLKFCFVGGYGTKPQTTFKLVEGPVLGMPIPSWDTTNNRHPRALFQAVAAFFSWNLEEPYEPIRQAMASYIQELCQAYTTGLLKKQVRLYTLPQQRKPGTNEPKGECIFLKKKPNGETYCPICPLICKTFPPAQLLRCWDYEIPCFSVQARLQLMLQQHNNNNNNTDQNNTDDLKPLFQKHLLEELKNKVGVKPPQGVSDVVMTYHQEKLDIMGWLIQQGANAHDPKIAHLLKRHGNAGFKGQEKKQNAPRRLDRQVYNRLREWGIAVTARDFQLVDLPNVRVVQRVD
ncbi:expressed unknown protein [Seminavis robusta]|uniref:F-box domain-containing protein n=1 Tax=Seminavis robusta TaxID=568900 RepID=A0A9N8EAA4_9STRA|nr:expressed unknown protein [Seminavis robusta]|eukprot:Sro670_g184670.1 n/a (427) ;mRNA; f:22298-23578